MKINHHSRTLCLGWVGGKPKNRLFNHLQKILVVKFLINCKALYFICGVLPFPKIVVAYHLDPLRNWYLVTEHQFINHISLLIVVPNLENIIKVEIFKVPEVFKPESLTFYIIVPIKLIHLVRKSDSFDFVIQNEVITSKRCLVILSTYLAFAFVFFFEIRDEPLHNPIIPPSDVNFPIISYLVQGILRLRLIQKVLSKIVLL